MCFRIPGMLYLPADAPLIEWIPQLREAGLAPFAA